MLEVDGLECTKTEMRYVLRIYRKNKKMFKPFGNDKVALYQYLVKLIREYRAMYGYNEDVSQRVKLEI